MRKKLLLLSILIASLFIAIGCSQNEEQQQPAKENEQKKEERSSIEVTQKKFEIVPSDYDDRMRIALCCEYKNSGNSNVIIGEVDFKLLDSNGISLGNYDYAEFAPQILAPNEIGYAVVYDASPKILVNPSDEISKMEVEILHKPYAEAFTNTLLVSDESIVDTSYNSANKAIQCIVENPAEKEVIYYDLLSAAYNSQGELLGVLSNMSYPTISPMNKVRINCDTGWFDIIDWTKVSIITGKGRVTTYSDEI